MPEIYTGVDTVSAQPLTQPQSKTDLFMTFSLMALQGFGGVLTVVQRELVERKRWMTSAQFIEEWSVAQIMPGPNVVNLCLMIGGRYFGLPGALAALAGRSADFCQKASMAESSSSPTRERSVPVMGSTLDRIESPTPRRASSDWPYGRRPARPACRLS